MTKPIFEFLLSDDKQHFTTSLVTNPAVESTLIFFDAETEKPSFFANEEKRMIYSVAMIPNKMIFRNATESVPDHYGFFSTETIEKFQENFAKFQGDNLVSINHDGQKVDGVYKVESWIVKDSENDKSKALGLEAINGSLIQGFKIENDVVWGQCKDGQLDGLSIEAYLNGKLTDTNLITMTKEEKTPQNLWDTMKSFFATDAPAPPAETPPAPPAPTKDLQAENDALTAKIAELEAKITELEAEDVKENADLATMQSQIEAVKAEFAKFKAETPSVAPISNTPPAEFKSDSPLEKFKKQHLTN